MIIERNFISAMLLAHLIEIDDQNVAVDLADLGRDTARLTERIAFAQIDSAAAELQRILKRRFDAHVKPAVDTSMQEGQ